jgi:AcrR family transcriptional regulator
VTRAAPEPSEPDDRSVRLLDAALATFVRYGFRKTSMEEVARAAGLSRQGLYLHHATKEELFRAVIRHFLESGLAAVKTRLDADAPLEDRLVGAFDAWVGRFVGLLGDNVSDLYEASRQLVGPLIDEHEEAFVDALAKLIRASGLPAAYRSVGLNARQIAETLNATARGLKHGCTSRPDFAQRMTLAVRAMCLPLRS